MANWMITCQNCSKSFVHSKVNEGGLVDYFMPSKPEFPEGGSEIACPHCGATSTYQSHHLTYQA